MVVWCVNYVILQHYILHLYPIFCKYGKNLLPLQYKRKQQPKHTSPSNL